MLWVVDVVVVAVGCCPHWEKKKPIEKIVFMKKKIEIKIKIHNRLKCWMVKCGDYNECYIVE